MKTGLHKIISMSSALASAVVLVAVAGCNDVLSTEAVDGEALSAQAGAVAAAASMSANRGSWNNWHVHDLPYGTPQYTDETGLRHEDYSIWPLIWPDYVSNESLLVYCTDAAEKLLVGEVGVVNGSKFASGTCRNDLYVIQIRVNLDPDAPVPSEHAGWEALDLGPFIFYYRLTSR